MALVSPGVEVSVVDESNYLPANTGTVPLVVLATSQDKTSGTGSGTAAGTTAAQAGEVYLITSQRDLTNTFGNPTFYQSSNGSPLHGYELNEYGLMAAYSLLGVSNRCYVVRADVDLSELVGTSSRPTGNPSNNTYWLDTTSDSLWGIFQWNKSTGEFTNQVPTVITSSTDLSGGIPKTSIGSIGDYAVVATNTNNPVYYKGSDNAWVLVGSTSWQQIVPAVQGTETSPTLTSGETVSINGTTITLSGTTITTFASDINSASITGITADVVNNKLEIYITSLATSDGSTVDGKAILADTSGTPFADSGITAGTYAAPIVQQSAHTSVPEWKSTDTTPRPTGAVWVKTTTPNNGADLDVSKFSTTTNTWSSVDAPLYENDWTSNKNLDSSGGGANIAQGSVYAQYDVSENDTITYKLFKRYATGVLTITAIEESPTLTSSETFTIQASSPGSASLSSATTITLSGTSIADMASDINAANISFVSASVNSSNKLVITHSKGGVIKLKDTSGTPLADAGISTSITSGQVRAGNDSDLILSNWIALTYTASATAPTSDPTDLEYWYDNSTDVDIMVHDGTNWKGYQNVTNDARGYDLSTTDPVGPQVSATEPTTQSDGTALVYGDLWIDSSDLENYPQIYRWQSVNSEDQWVLIDNTDQTTEDGILFADARYMGDTTTDVITGTVATIVSLLTNNTLDIDAPDADLYPRGMLLFNTRRSGGTVKQFRDDYFSRTNFSSTTDYPTLPTEKDAWITVSGNKNDGSPYMRRKAQRRIVVAALQSVLDSNTDIREEQREFNLISCPGYPEMIDNMVALNNDRGNTAFVIGDAPFRLSSDSSSIQTWAQNSNNAATGEDGISTTDVYLGVYYPSGQANDLGGNTIVVPPSHMVLRQMIRSDDISHPWIASAGTRRGIIDNADSIGYIDSSSGEFQSINVRQGTRDTLYENNINPITFINGTGLATFGNLTFTNTTSSMNRVNVSRLVASLRSQLESLSRPFVFEPNDKITRDELKQQVERTLNDLVAKRGVYDYLVVCDETNNTPTRIDRNELYVDVAIEPVKSAEFIFVPIRLKNTGEIAAGNIANAQTV